MIKYNTREEWLEEMKKKMTKEEFEPLIGQYHQPVLYNNILSSIQNDTEFYTWYVLRFCHSYW